MGNKRLTAVSLFSGCGGLDSGFEAAGFRILSAHDIDPVAVQNYNNNLVPVGVVSDISSKEFTIPSGVDVVISGSPCQGFSLVGKRNVLDPRNSLLLTSCELVRKASPRAAIFENVPGALAGAHKEIWDNGVKILQSAGYRVHYETIAMNDYGVAQMRKRVFLIAFKDRDPFSLSDTLRPVTPPSLRDVLDSAHRVGSGDLFLPMAPGSLDWRIAERIGPGRKLCDVRAGERSVHSWEIPEVFGETSSEEKELLISILKLRRQLRRRENGDADPVDIAVLTKLHGKGVVKKTAQLVEKNFLTFDGNYVDLRRRFNGKYRRFSWDAPSYTVDTNFGNPRYFLHPSEHRGFSVREAARIQSFPDTFDFSGSIRDQFKVIGNAVPPAISVLLAQQLKAALYSKL
ncbi:DNA cytosine methyltransferase [Massilia violaceinigra]|uniref:DNA cytosine methyltransferase n=1 Tax=Massilia violaceinigra TaxID=2045208 RepID=UPI0012FDD28F|nr:DNA cytosine methyltransferase [Massilia violaceinigra]